MNAFVLTTGRSGSTTLAKACSHIRNLSSSHERNWNFSAEVRLDYPPDHIEIGNRLSWFLGPLHARFPEARYVHLTRDPEEVAQSFVRRWTADPPRGIPLKGAQRLTRRIAGKYPGVSLVNAFSYGICGNSRRLALDERPGFSRFMVETINSNIREFLHDKPSIEIRLEEFRTDFLRFWEWVGAEGDKESALAELGVSHNASKP